LENAITVKNISKFFSLDQRKGVSKILNKQKNNSSSKKLTALDNISFDVKKGEVLGVIGLNGSGKTTLLRIIAGVYQPDIGTVEVKGRLSPLLQLGAGFQGDLNAQENIIMNGMLLGIPKSEIEGKVEKIIQFAELEKFSKLNLKYFSAGMRARLGFATAIQVNPDILLLDEILAVGDRIFKEKSYETIHSFKKNSKTILHATHNLDKLSELSDRVLLLDKGKNVILDEPELVIKKYKELR